MSLPRGEHAEEPVARYEPSVRVTYDDYVTFPDDQRYEVLDGEAFVVPSPNRRHQQLVVELVFLVRDHVRRFGGGTVFVAPFDVVLTNEDIVQPDVVFISQEDDDVLTDRNVLGTPTWVVEVLSPSTRGRDLTRKRQVYERTGVPEVWFVDPEEETVQVLVLRDGAYEETSVARPPEQVSPGCLPELEIPLDELFAQAR